MVSDFHCIMMSQRALSVFSNHVRSKNSQSTQGQSESCVSGQEVRLDLITSVLSCSSSIFLRKLSLLSPPLFQLTDRTPETPPDSVLLEEPVTKDDRVIDIVMPDRDASFINDIISSTPELAKFHGLMKARYVLYVCDYSARWTGLTLLHYHESFSFTHS